MKMVCLDALTMHAGTPAGWRNVSGGKWFSLVCFAETLIRSAGLMT